MGERTIAVFVSSHGFGHAARACALMQEVEARAPFPVRFEIYSEAPEWFFEESLPLSFELVPESVDVGLVQRTALEIDLDASLRSLRESHPVAATRLRALSKRLVASGARMVVADISPLGLLCAREAGLPSLLIENFTWDWIYRRLPLDRDALTPILAELERAVDSATVHLRTEPVCGPTRADRVVGSIARRPRVDRERTRARLGIPSDRPLALMSMGGVPWSHSDLGRLPNERLHVLAIGEYRGDPPPGVTVLPHHSRFHHPDLVAAADVLIGKLGYSTVAECWQAGTALLWIDRPGWPEQPALAAHVAEVLPSASIGPDELTGVAWRDRALELATDVRPRRPYRDGRAEAAGEVLTLLGRGELP